MQRAHVFHTGACSVLAFKLLYCEMLLAKTLFTSLYYTYIYITFCIIFSPFLFVCLNIVLSVNRITQKVVDKFLMNFLEDFYVQLKNS